jgi:hypothetical protein
MREDWRNYGNTCTACPSSPYSAPLHSRLVSTYRAVPEWPQSTTWPKLFVRYITPIDGVPKFEKNIKQAKTMDYITSTVLDKIETILCPASLSSYLDVSRCTRMALIHDTAEASARNDWSCSDSGGQESALVRVTRASGRVRFRYVEHWK